MNPLVSILLPVYNAEKFLKDAIESVLIQTYGNFELLIINDGSTDGCDQIIRSFTDKRIRYLINETNIQLIQTLNRGIKEAKGKYIARMDADDICHKDRILTQLRFMEENPMCSMCCSWAHLIDKEGKITGSIKRIDSNNLLKVNMLFTNPFIHPTLFIKTEILKANLYSEKAKHCEDLELWIRLAQNPNNNFKNIKGYLLKYRIHSSNISVVNTDFQNLKRKELIVPFVEKLVGTMTEKEIYLHFLSFIKNKLTLEELIEEKEWFIKLLKCNKEKKSFSQFDLNALVLSRWWIVCHLSKKYHYLFFVPMKWFNPIVFFKAIKLIFYK